MKIHDYLIKKQVGSRTSGGIYKEKESNNTQLQSNKGESTNKSNGISTENDNRKKLKFSKNHEKDLDDERSWGKIDSTIQEKMLFL